MHTSTATVAVLPEAEDVEVEINPKDLQIDTFKASGAGGQHVNKTESAIRITHVPSGVIVSCSEERSQLQNRERAMGMLRSVLLDRKRREAEEAVGSLRKSQVGTGRSLREDPHLQLPARPHHRSPHQRELRQHRRRDERRPRPHRGAPAARREDATCWRAKWPPFRERRAARSRGPRPRRRTQLRGLRDRRDRARDAGPPDERRALRQAAARRRHDVSRDK